MQALSSSIEPNSLSLARCCCNSVIMAMIRHWSHKHELRYVSDCRTVLAGGEKGRNDHCSRCHEAIIQGPVYVCKKNDCGFVIDASCFGLSEDHHQQVRTRVNHWSHKHGLKYVSSSAALAVKEEGRNDCSGCHETIQGPAYVCEKDACGFMLDQSCFGLSKNHQLLHPLHPHHPLQLSDNTKQLQQQRQTPRICSDNVCDGCNYICGPLSFRCQEDCNFKLDVRCALSLSKKSHNSDDGQQIKPTTINHFLHPHSLSLFNCRENDDVGCAICNDSIVGPAYGCFQCQRQIYLHIACAEFPSKIQHPFHPQHHLSVPASLSSQGQSTSVCKSCKWSLGAAAYQCSPCGFGLHMLCARQTRFSSPLKLDRLHQHNLYYTVGDKYEESDDEEDPDGGSDDVEDDPDGGSECDDGEDESPVEETDGEGEYNKRIVVVFRKICSACNKNCEKSYYRCLECKYIIHLRCMGLPATVHHSCHFHPLTLVDKFVEDDSGVYYCQACGQERNPDCPVYLCEDKECLDNAPFAAHIECVVSEETDIPSSSYLPVTDEPVAETYPALVEFDEAKRKPHCKLQVETKDFSNDHALTFYERRTNPWFDGTCYGCKRKIRGGSYYACQSCEKYFHKLCAELPLMIRHSLHPQHTLSMFPPYDSQLILCDGCGKFSDGGYKCDGCEFMLDIRCASLTADQFQDSKYRKITISHPLHEHELTFTGDIQQEDDTCFACQVPILNAPSYTCLGCSISFHERCLQIPQEITEHAYHPEHPLFAEESFEEDICKACKLRIDGIGYRCKGCEFTLHTRCADYITTTLKCKSHNKHTLFSFAKTAPEDFLSALSRYGPAYDKSTFKCKVCRKQCLHSFYRCVKCDMNFHLHCLSIPHKVLHPCHFNPLTLADVMPEDEYGEYYCELCPDQRNPYHGVYHCQECKKQGQECNVIAHVGCVLEEMDGALEIIS